ncbi:chemotaxis protein CheX [Hyalangium gracile]|uniref:chemotaxis protein CheX n=1 Tax=Hyalangium gracile TaxID=394092 RepID=UPI001CCB0878|nr:chemotaxis protein CheX [Hyalangium gracile]
MSTAISAEVVNAFVSSLVNIFQAATGLKGELSPLTLTTELPPPPTFVVSIQIRGPLFGPTIWSFTPGVAGEITARMLGNASSPPYDTAEVKDAVSEVANIVVGNATDALLKAGYPVDLSPPKAEFATSAEKLLERTLTVSLNTSAGPLSLHLALRQA